MPTSGVQAVYLAPGEPAAQLVGVQGMGVPGVAGQVGHRGELRRCHRVGLERQNNRVGCAGHGWAPAAWRACPGRGPPHTARPLGATVDHARGRWTRAEWTRTPLRMTTVLEGCA